MNDLEERDMLSQIRIDERRAVTLRMFKLLKIVLLVGFCFLLVSIGILTSTIIFSPTKEYQTHHSISHPLWYSPGKVSLSITRETTNWFTKSFLPDGVSSECYWVTEDNHKIAAYKDVFSSVRGFLSVANIQKSDLPKSHVTEKYKVNNYSYDFYIISIKPTIVIASAAILDLYMRWSNKYKLASSQDVFEREESIELLALEWEQHMHHFNYYGVTSFPYQPDVIWFSPSEKVYLSRLDTLADNYGSIRIKNTRIILRKQDSLWVTERR